MRLKSVKKYAMFRSWCFCTVRTIAQFGSALDWGSRGRGFKSRWSDQESPSFQHFHSIGAMGFSLCEAIGAINAFNHHDSAIFPKSEWWDSNPRSSSFYLPSLLDSMVAGRSTRR